MKQGIHPNYVECTVRCTCGNTWVTRSTKSEMTLDLCDKCHPFYTGQQKLVDTGGRVQRFADKFGSAKDMVAEREAAKKAEREKKAAEKAKRAEEYAKKAEEEAARAAECGAVTVGLGPRILRCETAPLAVLSAVMTLTGNLE